MQSVAARILVGAWAATIAVLLNTDRFSAAGWIALAGWVVFLSVLGGRLAAELQRPGEGTPISGIDHVWGLVGVLVGGFAAGIVGAIIGAPIAAIGVPIPIAWAVAAIPMSLAYVAAYAFVLKALHDYMDITDARDYARSRRDEARLRRYLGDHGWSRSASGRTVSATAPRVAATAGDDVATPSSPTMALIEQAVRAAGQQGITLTELRALFTKLGTPDFDRALAEARSNGAFHERRESRPNRAGRMQSQVVLSTEPGLTPVNE